MEHEQALKFIHLSDCHISANDAGLAGAKPTEQLRNAVDVINEYHDDADFVVLTGDLTHCGDDSSYKILNREISRLTIPCHLLLGNHDNIRSFGLQFTDSPRCQHGYIQGSKPTAQGLCLFLDTNVQGTTIGYYCEKRREWLRNCLEQTDGPLMLFMHHPPFIAANDPSRYPNDAERKILAINAEDAEAFWDVLKPHKDRVRHIFFGHLHNPIFGNWRGISYSCMRSLVPELSPRVKLSSLSAAAREEDPISPAGFGVVMLTDDTLTVHLNDLPPLLD